MSPGQYNVHKQDIIAKVFPQNYIPITVSNIKDRAKLSHHCFIIISHAQVQLLTLPSFDLAKIFSEEGLFFVSLPTSTPK